MTPLPISNHEFVTAVSALGTLAHSCSLCPRRCGVDRLADERGECGGGRHPSLMSYGPHHGEEACLSGWCGSGTLFFGHCNLHCVFCQNAEISQDHRVCRLYECPPSRIADAMIELQSRGCHNINLVSPTHNLNGIAEALLIARRNGLRLPVVYNTNAYDSVEALQLLHGIVDIYLPDLKYAENNIAATLGAPSDYVERARAAITEMYRQVGHLECDRHGIARQGVLIRHLVLPGNCCDSFRTLHWICETLGENTTVNIMAQYHPAYRAHRYPPFDRRLDPAEYAEVVRYARTLGMRNVIVDRSILAHHARLP